MRNLVNEMLEAQANLALCEANLRAAVVAKIKKDFRGYKLPDGANMKIDENGKIHVGWQDLSALSYGFYHDGYGYIRHCLDPKDL